MTEEITIRSASDARRCIGQIVYWDDVGTRYVMLRQGKLEKVEGKNLLIDGNYKYRTHLKNLRNFADGGDWKNNE